VSTIKTKQVEKATAICLTHGHINHIGDSFQLVRQTGAKLICTPELGFYAEFKGLKEGEEVYGLNTGGSWHQMLPAEWVEESQQPHATFDRLKRYGYLMWVRSRTDNVQGGTSPKATGDST